jgi:predicted DNA-binding transcriptional regulator AlpA
MTIIEITSNRIISPPPSTCLYIEDIMADLGIKSRSTIYRWIERGVGPPLYKAGSGRNARPRCDRADYERWKAEKKPWLAN